VFESDSDDTYRIVSVLDTNLALTDKNAGHHTLSLETYTNQPNQQFKIFQENNKSAFVSVATNTALCVFQDNKFNKGELRTDAGNHASSWFDIVPVTAG